MATPPLAQQQSSFYSTPGFKLYQRGLVSVSVQKFHGINAYTPLNQLSGDWAQDLLNVIVGGSGLLGKMRLPVSVDTHALDSFWDFQQGTGLHQIVGHQGNNLFYLDVNNNFNYALIDSNNLNTGQWDFVAANNILFGANGQRMMKWTGSAWQGWGIAVPTTQPQILSYAAGGLSPTTGYAYMYAYMNSVTGHVGNASVASVNSGPRTNVAPVVQAYASTDPQVNTLVWFRTLDGGGSWYRLAQVTLATGVVTFNNATVTAGGVGNLQITDNTPDSALDLTIQAPIYNGLPPQGKYLAVGQGRVFVAGLASAPATMAYSGYEQILIGRPEESFPPDNELLLTIGADSISGVGVLQVGVVLFSQSHRMYFLRGQLEDITLNAPVNFSEQLEELPWTIGCMSHESIAFTPYGLVWLATDKTVQFWSGQSDPIDISVNVYPYLRAITPGTESQCIGTYFNWVERDWYAMTACINGSLTPNRIFFFGLNAKSADIEIFISDVATSWLSTVEDVNKQRKLYIAQPSGLKNLPVSATDIGGIVQQQFRTPATNETMNAYWQGAYFGTDEPQRSKMWRYIKMICDGDPRAYKAQHRFTDDVLYTLAAPQLVGPVQFTGPRMGINVRANRYSCEIDFPSNDSDMNVLELQVSNIATSDR